MSEQGGEDCTERLTISWNNTDPRLLLKYPSTLLGRTHKRDSEEAKLICQWQKKKIGILKY